MNDNAPPHGIKAVDAGLWRRAQGVAQALLTNLHSDEDVDDWVEPDDEEDEAGAEWRDDWAGRILRGLGLIASSARWIERLRVADGSVLLVWFRDDANDRERAQTLERLNELGDRGVLLSGEASGLAFAATDASAIGRVTVLDRERRDLRGETLNTLRERAGLQPFPPVTSEPAPSEIRVREDLTPEEAADWAREVQAAIERDCGARGSLKLIPEPSTPAWQAAGAIVALLAGSAGFRVALANLPEWDKATLRTRIASIVDEARACPGPGGSGVLQGSGESLQDAVRRTVDAILADLDAHGRYTVSTQHLSSDGFEALRQRLVGIAMTEIAKEPA